MKDAFLHSWRGYERHAWGHDEIHPVTNDTNDSWGGMAATMIDALDTLHIMGLDREFQRSKDFVERHLHFERSRVVSFFETTIRFVGGLLGAYELSRDRIFLDKAAQLADKLLPAFETKSGLPLHAVNLATGEAENARWSGGDCILSEVGSFQLEFEYLSHHTGNPVYAQKARHAIGVLQAANEAQPVEKRGLYPILLNPATGQFTADRITIGGLADSFYEYLLKMYLWTGKRDERALAMYIESKNAIVEHLWQYSSLQRMAFVAERNNDVLENKFEHLSCFFAGVLALGEHLLGDTVPQLRGDIQLGMQLVQTCVNLYRSQPTGIGPESVLFHHPNMSPEGFDFSIEDPKYLLRPETVESLFILYRVTGDESLREIGWSIFLDIEKWCRTPSGFSGLKDVRDTTDERFNNSQQSFFHAETLKYLYLLFSDEDRFPLDQYVFTTEAHVLGVLQNSNK